MKRKMKNKSSRKNVNRRRKKKNNSNGTETLIFTLLILILIVIFFMIIILHSSESDESIISRINSISNRSTSGDAKKAIKTEKAEKEEKILWDMLMEHFDNNETAVLGIMCNIKEESGFKANNLEDINNEIWNISDDDYTKRINKGKMKDDFIQSQYKGKTSGYTNSYGQWCNINGGYGYCQYTAYEKKRALYEYAENWFGKDGEGRWKRFNLADPKMQSSFIVYLLDNDLSDIDSELRNAETVPDAVYIWLSKYEIPEGDYYELTYSRAAYAEDIKSFCTEGKKHK